MKFHTLIAATVFSLGALGVSASEAGGYAGAGILNSGVDDSGLNDRSTGADVFGGYRFNPNFSLEGFYADLGKYEERIGAGRISLDAQTFGVRAVGAVPLTDGFSLYARVGFQRWDAKVEGSAGTQLLIGEDSGTDLTLGLGGEFAFSERVALRGGWDRYKFDDVDADAASLGLKISF